MSESTGIELTSVARPIPMPGRFAMQVVVFETGFALIALGLAIFTGFFDHQRPLAGWFDQNWIAGIAIGILIALPLYGIVIHWLPSIEFLRPAIRSIEDKVLPLFDSMKIWQVAVVSLSAGIGEELLFRWCIQGGLANAMPMWSAVVIGSVVFGLAHWLTFAYFVMATLLGAVLAAVYLAAGPIPAICCHATYDFLAILSLMRSNQSKS